MESCSRVILRKLDLECCIPGTVAVPGQTEKKIKKIAREYLGEVLADLLQPLNAAGEGIVLVKRLELEFDIDLLLSHQQIARVWANRIKSALLRAMNGKAAANVAVFENSACYLRSALMDIIRGRAQHLWYYRGLSGLWALPVSSAVRTLLLEDRDNGLAAVARMQGTELVEFAAALSEKDANWLLRQLFQERVDASVTHADMNRFVASVSDVHALANGLEAHRHQQAMLLACLALSRKSEIASSTAVQCARHLSMLMRLRHEFPDSFRHITRLIMHKRPAGLKQWLPGRRITRLAPLLRMDARSVHSLVELLAPERPPAENTPAKFEQVPRFTRFGNALLLLPQFDKLPLEALQHWQPLGAQPALPLVRLLVICLCQGESQFAAAFRDPLLRDLCGIRPDIALAEIVQWLNLQTPPSRLMDVYRDLENDIVRADHPLQHCAWRLADILIVVHGETQKGCWVKVTITDQHAPQANIPETRQDEDPERVIADFNALWLANLWGLSNEACAILSVLAQITIKTFAYRLPGFAKSSVNYMRQNFLSMTATLVAEEQRIRASLSRVPMSIMLNMAGMNRGTILLPHFDHRPIRLTESG